MTSDLCDGAYLPVLAHVLEYVLRAALRRSGASLKGAHRNRCHGEHFWHALEPVPVAPPFGAIWLDQKTPAAAIGELVCSLPGSRQADGGISYRHIATSVQMSNFAARARFESFFSEDPKLPSFKRGWGGMGWDALSRRFGKKPGKTGFI
jgi:hypothetical protein